MKKCNLLWVAGAILLLIVFLASYRTEKITQMEKEHYNQIIRELANTQRGDIVEFNDGQLMVIDNVSGKTGEEEKFVILLHDRTGGTANLAITSEVAAKKIKKVYLQENQEWNQAARKFLTS